MYLRSKMLIRPLQKRRRNDWKKEVLRRMNEKGKCAILERERERSELLGQFGEVSLSPVPPIRPSDLFPFFREI